MKQPFQYKNIKDMGNGIWREKTPEEKFRDRLIEAGVDENKVDSTVAFIETTFKRAHGL